MIWNRCYLHPALLLVLVCLLPMLACALPEALLNAARDAEKLAGTGKLKEAAAAYEKLDREFPGHAPVSLRLGQLHDQLNQPGEALFYYRRYAARSTRGVREEARERLAALELVPGAPEGAQKVAERLKEQTAPVPVPTPAVRHSVAAVGEDGLLRPLHGPQDLERLQRGEDIPAETPAPAVSPLTGAVPTAAAATAGRHTSQIPAARETSASPAPAGSGAHTPAPSADEDAALAAAFARRSAGETAPLLSPATTRSVIVLPERRQTPPPSSPRAAQPETLTVESFNSASGGKSVAAATPARLIVEDAGGAAPSLSGLDRAVQPPPPRAPAGSQAAKAVPPLSSGAGAAATSKMFDVRPAGGTQAQLKLANTVEESILTFAAIPDNGGTPINAVLLPGEVRTLRVPPGVYEVVISATTNDYAPRTLLDRRNEQDFVSGMLYTFRLTPDLIMGL